MRGIPRRVNVKILNGSSLSFRRRQFLSRKKFIVFRIFRRGLRSTTPSTLDAQVVELDPCIYHSFVVANSNWEELMLFFIITRNHLIPKVRFMFLLLGLTWFGLDFFRLHHLRSWSGKFLRGGISAALELCSTSVESALEE